MNSREKILAAVKKNQPPVEPLPLLTAIDGIRFSDPALQFKTILESIGGQVIAVAALQEVTTYVQQHFTEGKKYITSIAELNGIEKINNVEIGHKLEDVEVAIINGVFGVAENAAIWVAGSSFRKRVLPFICQHLVLVLDPASIVHNMHEAYEKIGDDGYDYGVFIAGPSKTADIEQSLVLGAHGARSMTVFFINAQTGNQN